MKNQEKYPHIGRGNQRLIRLRNAASINIDNGAATTIDEVLSGGFPFETVLVSARAVYTEATDTTLGNGTAAFSLGITAGGATLLAATLLQASKAVGAYTEGTPSDVVIPANTPIFNRHLGIAATEAGQYYVEALFLPKP